MAEDGTALLYDAPTGTPSAIRSARDGRTSRRRAPPRRARELAAVHARRRDGLGLDPEHQFEDACRIAGRDLTENEWRTYLDGLGEPQSTCGFAD